MREAAKLYGIPRSTLNDRYNGRHGHTYKKTILSEVTEKLIIETLCYLADIGHGFGRDQVLMMVDEYLKQTNQSHLFKNGKPSKDWYYDFLKRHSDKVHLKNAGNISQIRALSSKPEVVLEWFEKLAKVYDKYGLKDKPANIFNCDESGFACERGVCKIVAPRTNKAPLKISGNNAKAQYTVLACCNADGEYLPLNIIYKATYLCKNWCLNGPKDAGYDCSPSGWMEGKQFLNWFRSIFLKHCAKLPKDEYKILIFDGHHSHISLELIDLARANKIVLICLPPHITHFLQPLDICVFSVVKRKWKSVLDSFFVKSQQLLIGKNQFPSLIKEGAVAFTRTNAIKGFEMSGIYPYDPERIKPKLKLSDGCSSNSSQIPQTPASSIPSAQVVNVNTQDSTPAATQPKPKPKPLENLISEASVGLHNSIKQLIDKTAENRPTGRSRAKRSLDFVLTEDEVRAQLLEEEAAKKRKLDLANERKKKKELKQARQAQISESIDNVISSLESENGTDLAGKKCYKCSANWISCQYKNDWLNCEDCDNWCCYLCLGASFNRQLSYFCKNCKN